MDEKNFLRTIIEAINGPIFYKDREGKYCGCNRAFEEFIKINREDLLGKTVFEIAPKELAEVYKKADDDLFNKGGTQVYESQVLDKHGRLKNVVFYKSLFHDEENNVAGLVGIGVDVTELKNAQRELDLQRAIATQAGKLTTLGEMGASIAHEINNPLAVIAGMSSIIEKELSKPDVDLEYIKGKAHIITLTTQRISKIIENLRNFSRDASFDSYVFKTVDHLVMVTLSLCEERFKKSNIKLIIKNEHNDLGLFCNEVEISQILLNLLNNAYDACFEQKSDRWVKIIIIKNDPNIHFKVVDSGAGVEQAIVPKIMQPFFTTKPVGKGTGLGLSISYQIAKKHKGDLFLEANQAHTTFVLTLPINKT